MLSQLDRFVKTEQERALERAEAAKQLASIASRFPDLVEACAALCHSNGETERPDEATKPLSKQQLSIAQTVLGFLEKHGESPASAVAANVAPNIETTVNPPSKIVYSTLASLERTNKIQSRRNEEGRKLYKIRPRWVKIKPATEPRSVDPTKTIRQQVIDALRGTSLTIEELEEKTGLTRHQVRTPIYAKDSKHLFRCQTDDHRVGHYSLALEDDSGLDDE